MKRIHSSFMCSSLQNSLWSSLLVLNAMGAECSLATMFMLMVANLQNLDVPVAFASVPSLLAAAISMTFVISMGVISEKFANSRSGKSLVLVLANLLQFAGAICVISGNVTKLLYYDDSYVPCNSTKVIPLNKSTPNNKDVSVTPISDIGLSPFPVSELPYSCNGTSGRKPEIVSSLLPIPLHTLLVVVGFALLDAGYDPTNCFLKTYAMAFTPPESHTHVLVKSTFLNAFGGVFLTLIGSLNIGEWLMAGTTQNLNVVRTIFIASTALTVGILSLVTSLLVGWLHFASRSFNSPIEEDTVSERERLLPDKDKDDNEGDDISWSASVKMAHSVLERPSNITKRLRASSKSFLEKESKSSVLYVSAVGKFSDFFRQHNVRIFLCLGTLFACCTLFAFDVYSVNFVGVAIYKGDPTAAVNSEKYFNYLKGEKAGSTGLLLFYISSFLVGSMQNFILRRFGWWRTVSRGTLIYVINNFCCAFFLREWLFYLGSCLTGSYRVLIFTFPFVLIAKRSKQKEVAGESAAQDMDMALTAAMAPASFLMASGLTGPLVSLTGNAASSVYLTVATTTIAFIFYWFIRRC